MIYFDNAATSFPKPAVVAQAMTKFLTEDAANPGRAGHRMAVRAEQMLDDVRLKLTRLIKGDDHHRLIFAMNGTDALNMAIKGVLSEHTTTNGGKPHVITTVLEHNSVSRPLQGMAARGDIDLTRVRCDAVGNVDPDDIRNAITPATQLIALTHASNVLGTMQNAAAVGAIAREHDLLFLLDAAQTIGVVPIDINAMHVDLLAFPGHKSLLGPTGTGALYVGERCPEPAEALAATHEAGHLDQQITRKGKLRALNPWREGGTGGDSATPTQPPLYPYYLEGGTPNTVGIVGLGAALDTLTPEAMAESLEHEQAQCARLIERFADDDRFTVYGPQDASKCVGTLSINLEGFEPSDLGSILDDSFDIAVRPGLHCSPYTHRQLGTFPSGTLRISPGAFNTDEQLDQLIDALEQIAG
ncbi:aminotransferase class V-fold PLP-dependent enzyme [Phycisphaerales bacterium AB-hyl4]|uniref:cysteine desulfurase n=1 Tax=Natronomicrosphaera hydrolytica TaxID=3242702 RepID=A0ABV4U6G1_9BACT